LRLGGDVDILIPLCIRCHQIWLCCLLGVIMNSFLLQFYFIGIEFHFTHLLLMFTMKSIYLFWIVRRAISTPLFLFHSLSLLLMWMNYSHVIIYTSLSNRYTLTQWLLGFWPRQVPHTVISSCGNKLYCTSND